MWGANTDELRGVAGISTRTLARARRLRPPRTAKSISSCGSDRTPTCSVLISKSRLWMLSLRRQLSHRRRAPFSWSRHSNRMTRLLLVQGRAARARQTQGAYRVLGRVLGADQVRNRVRDLAPEANPALVQGAAQARVQVPSPALTQEANPAPVRVPASRHSRVMRRPIRRQSPSTRTCRKSLRSTRSRTAK